MMPEKLVFEAFGPYVKRQEIDFRIFEQAGLFLIHGKTGAGKTTVLDAMTYALFGESSGGNRGEISGMRSDFAPEEQDMFVDFIFRAHEKRYRFSRGVRVRTKRNGEKELQPFQTVFFMKEDGSFEPFFENPGIKNVRQKAEEILGLTYEQFRQVVLLPQGKFEQLLVADSAAKEEILVTLFKAEQWSEISDLLSAQALGMKRAKEEGEQSIKALLAQYECASAEELAGRHTQKKEMVEEQQFESKRAEEQLATAQRILQNALTVESLFEECEVAKKEEQVLKQKAPQIDQLEAQCARALLATQLLPARKEVSSLQKQWQEREERVKKLHYEISNDQESLSKYVKTLSRILLGIETERAGREKERENVTTKILEAEKTYQMLLEIYRNDTAYMLAEHLQEGSACPVCGSTHHPNLAQDSEKKATLEDVKHAETQMNKLQKQKIDLEQRIFISIREEEECREGLNRLGVNETEHEAYDADTNRDGWKEKLAKGNELFTKIKIARKSIVDYEEEEQQAKEAFEQALSEFRVLCEEKGFHTDDAFRAAYMSEQEIQAAQKQIQEYRIQKEIAAARVKSYVEKLNGIERIALTPLKEEAKKREIKKKSVEEDLAKSKAILDMMQKTLITVQKKEQSLQKQIEEYVALDSFSKLLKGSNGIGLQRYVLGVMLTAITQEANLLLKKVHDGRYQLYRAMEGTGRSRKVGLDLEVFDSYSGERRSVNSLSGGEKFLVALALSLGLSTVVQAQSGGIHIDAMFIDEGFGSLDPGSIENALDILASVRGASKLIGIISHVQMLKENIEATIEVRKERTGSDLVIHY